jgi:phosphoenolpyruvate phosphomutase
MPASKSLRARLATGDLLHVMAAHSPLSARLAEEAGFDALWASGFELSALYGLADMSLLSMTQHLDMVRAMAGQTDLPIVADIDTGYGNAVNVDHVVREYERAGASAVVIEDKSFPKVTSLLADGRQELIRSEEFAGKIQAALAARKSPDFLIIARTEALIAGLGQEEALRRCHAYTQAGADMLLVHSKSKSPAEIEKFIAAWDGLPPLVLVPTAYPDLTAARIAELGKVRMVIYGNHAIRAAITGMRSAFAAIVAERGIKKADGEIVSVAEVFRLQRMEEVRRLEERFLR